jgi:tetratricopeptide (TPR) repeat protein
MKVSLIVVIVVLVLFFGCGGAPVPVDQYGNFQQNIRPANAERITPSSSIFEPDSLLPTYNVDGSLTLFTINGVQGKIMPMTFRGDRGGLSRNIDGYEALIARYTEVLDVNPYDYEACITLAALYVDRGESGDAELAVKYCDQALNISKNDLRALYLRALAYKEQGESEKALIDLYLVLQLNDQSLLGIYYVMGMIQYDNLDIEEAIESFEEAKAIDPNFADIEEILQQLYELKF